MANVEHELYEIADFVPAGIEYRIGEFIELAQAAMKAREEESGIKLSAPVITIAKQKTDGRLMFVATCRRIEGSFLPPVHQREIKARCRCIEWDDAKPCCLLRAQS